MESRVIELTPAAHKHGNLNLSACGKEFFPPDVFGASSKKAGLGTQIMLQVEGFPKPIETDIPTDKKTRKPRWIFRERAWVKQFISSNRLVPGDTITITRLDKGTYKVTPNNNRSQTSTTGNQKSSIRKIAKKISTTTPKPNKNRPDKNATTKHLGISYNQTCDLFAFTPLDRPLIINKSKILALIEKLKIEESLSSLRNSVFRLQSYFRSVKMDKVGVLNIDSNGDTITISQKYVFDQLNQIVESQTLDRAKYYVERFEKAITQVKTSKINDINLNRWKEYDDILTDSLWVIDKRDNTGVHTAGYWGNFIPQIPNQMLKRYTKKGDWVLDPFVGCGTTLIESQRLGRNGIGAELQETVAQKARELISSEPNRYHVVTEILTDDSRTVDFKEVLKKHNQKSVQLLIMHPPYFDIIKFSNNPRDLSNAPSVDKFLEMMNTIVDNASSVLKKGRYLILVIGDKYSKGEWIPLGFLTMNEILQRGFLLKSIIVKNFEETTAKRNQKELWRYRALAGGFYIFKHEYIFVFKKK